MKRLYVIGLLIILSRAQEVFGMLRHTQQSLISTSFIFGGIKRLAKIQLPRYASVCNARILQQPTQQEAAPLKYVPFDRHTAAKILRERKAREARERK